MMGRIYRTSRPIKPGDVWINNRREKCEVYTLLRDESYWTSTGQLREVTVFVALPIKKKVEVWQ